MIKKFCRYCGEPILPSSPRTKFCSNECATLFHSRKPKPVSIKNNFNLFKNIVAASESPFEFKLLWNKYFKEVH